jgi:hypothetical protein
MIIILSSFATLLMVEHLNIPVRLAVVISWGARASEATVYIGLFGAWTLATALIYRFPGIAVWGFAVSGLIGLASSRIILNPAPVLWGGIATGFALLTTLARREHHLAEQSARHRAQHEMAVYLALRSLQETVPELLARVPDTGVNAVHPVQSCPRTRAPHRVSTKEQIFAGWSERSRG